MQEMSKEYEKHAEKITDKVPRLRLSVDGLFSAQKEKECFVQFCMRSCYDNPQHENIYELSELRRKKGVLITDNVGCLLP